jgi:hypothetical protein
MHIGFYIETNGGTPQNTEIYNALNEAVENEEVDDASVFYNNIDFNPVTSKFGMFNSADMWSFKGLLIATSTGNVIRASKIVNNFKLAYLYDPFEKEGATLFSLMGISKIVPIITKTKEDSDEVFRLTGKESFLLGNFSIKDIIEVLYERV